MKIFSIRNLLGIGAVYAAAQYAKNHGGARNAFEGLIAKVKDAANAKKEELVGKAHDASVGSESSQSSAYDTGTYSGGGYSSDVGGNGTTRRS